jgi:hypothetical protein
LDEPNPAVDLAALPLAPILAGLPNAGAEVLLMPLTQHMIPTAEQLEGLGTVEDVTAIGYLHHPANADPSKLLPIVRRRAMVIWVTGWWRWRTEPCCILTASGLSSAAPLHA